MFALYLQKAAGERKAGSVVLGLLGFSKSYRHLGSSQCLCEVKRTYLPVPAHRGKGCVFSLQSFQAPKSLVSLAGPVQPAATKFILSQV